MRKKSNYLLLLAVMIGFGFFSSEARSEMEFKLSDSDKDQQEIIGDALDYADDGKNEKALKKLAEWNPEPQSLAVYKKYWQSVWSNDLTAIWAVYRELKQQKQYVRVRLELLKEIIQKNVLANELEIKKESRSMLRYLKGTSEGEEFETTYLKWIQKNKFYDEICRVERNRWIGQPDIDYVEMTAGVKDCPLKIEDFLMRLRRLLFAAKEFQAERELEMYLADPGQKLKDWEKVYVQSIFSSHRGEPDVGFASLSKHESDVMSSDFAENYFYISQRAGQLDKAESIVEALLKRTDVSAKKKRDLLFQKGLLYYQNAKYSQANKIFDQFVKTHPSHKAKKKSRDYEQAAWLKAWTYYLQNDYDEAIKSFNETQKYTSDPSRLAYWVAMSYLNKSEEISAYQLFKKLAAPVLDKKSYSYYNLMAWIRYVQLKNKNKKNDLIQILYALTKDRNSSFPTLGDDYTQSKMLDLYVQILDQPTGIEEESINVVNTENDVIYSDENKGLAIANESDLERNMAWAQFLIKNKRGELAKWHLYEIEKNLKKKTNILKLAEFYKENEFYYRALSLVQRASQIFNESISFSSSLTELGSLYPQAYKKNVEKEAKRREVEPFFIWSIMRAETLYKSDAISPVGAVGLMQFMPYTKEKVASLIEDKISNEELFKPEVSVKYGAAYIKKLSIEFNKADPLMAAAYNGGPHRVKAWISRLKQQDYDVFIEHIPFAETRTYVKRIVTFKSIYEKLYNKEIKEGSLDYLVNPIEFKAPETLVLKEEWEPFRKEVQKSN